MVHRRDAPRPCIGRSGVEGRSPNLAFTAKLLNLLEQGGAGVPCASHQPHMLEQSPSS